MTFNTKLDCFLLNKKQDETCEGLEADLPTLCPPSASPNVGARRPVDKAWINP